MDYEKYDPEKIWGWAMKFINSTLRYGAPIAWPILFWWIIIEKFNSISSHLMQFFFFGSGVLLTFVSLFSVLKWICYYRKQQRYFRKVLLSFDDYNHCLNKEEKCAKEFQNHKNTLLTFADVLSKNPVDKQLFQYEDND